MLCLPFGTSLQSLATTSVSFFLLITKRQRLKDIVASFSKVETFSLICLLLITLLPMAATLLNPKNPEGDVISYFLGFIPLLFVPCLFMATPSIAKEGLEKLEKIWTGIMLAWVVVLVTQSIWGWKIQGVEVVRGLSYTRSQGFYSHPLTLAYVALIIWPFHLILLCKDFKNLYRYLLVFANLGLLYFSASRTAQAVALLAAVGFIFVNFRGRNRLIIMAVMAAGLLGVFSSNNAISRRFLSMSTKMMSEEKESPYPDDRIAFWIVHWNMVKERPILGHGISLDRAYRIPYYEAIGLSGFKKAYEAHNQVLQLAAEGGLGAALAFLLWLGSLAFNWKHAPRTLKQIRNLTILCLLLGGLTQNAYLDGEVRFALMTLMSLVYAMGTVKLYRKSEP